MIKKTILPLSIFAVLFVSYFYYFHGVLVLFPQAIFYAIIICFIAFLTFRENNHEKQALYVALAFTIFAIFLPILVQKDSEIKQLIATNEYNCRLTVNRTKQIMADFKSGHLTKFEKQYVVDSYSSNLGYLVAKDASTTIDLIGKLQSQNTLLSERISVESDFYMLIAETDFLKKADIAQQSINGLDYFFLLEARSIFNEINGLQTKISGSDIKDCSMPEIPSYICANSGVSGECWQN